MGFGLNISERIISKLGGSLKLLNNSALYQNEHVKGATAVIEFPIRKDELIKVSETSKFSSKVVTSSKS